MKRIVLFTTMYLISFSSLTQNIGINTGTPTYPMTFQSMTGDKISFWGGDGAANNNHYGIGVQSSLLQIFAPPGGDIALGTGRSTAFNENFRVSSLGEVSSKGTFAGYTFYDRNDLASFPKRFVWYNASGSARLFSGTIGDVIAFKHDGNVGIGTTDPQAKLHVNGDLRITDGTQGSGKVLTSDAAGNTSWTESALNNNERFFLMFTFSNTQQPNSYVQGYETSPDITINTTTGVVTINKTGIYHFETNVEVSTVVGGDYSQFATLPELFKAKMVVTSGGGLPINNQKFTLFRNPFFREDGATLCKGIGRGSIDIFLIAPATVKMEFSTTNSLSLNSGLLQDNFFSGYLISE